MANDIYGQLNTIKPDVVSAKYEIKILSFRKCTCNMSIAWPTFSKVQRYRAVLIRAWCFSEMLLSTLCIKKKLINI